MWPASSSCSRAVRGLEEVGRLVDDPDVVPAQGGEAAAGERGGGGAGDEHVAGGRLAQQPGHGQQGRLAAARGPGDDEHLAGGDVEVDPVEQHPALAPVGHRHGEVAEGEGEAVVVVISSPLRGRWRARRW